MVRVCCMTGFSWLIQTHQGAWGYDLFQSDTDLDAVYDLSRSAELYKIKKTILADPAKYSFRKQSTEPDDGDSFTDEDVGKDEDDIYVTLYQPSHPDLVRDRLNDGVLLRMTNDLRNKNQGYMLCILIACAMQLGCNIPGWRRSRKKLRRERVVVSEASMFSRPGKLA